MTYRILVTGGAGFVGANIALAFKRAHPEWTVVAFDSLRRRGSELALERLRAGEVVFQHGDVRSMEDLAQAGAADLLIECSAEPSVHAGYGGDSPRYVIDTNLAGTVNCLELLRRAGGDLIFLSTSRVYPIASLRELPLEVHDKRLVLPAGGRGPGWSEAGISESFPLGGSRSLYGATKLAAELLIQEYQAMYGLRAIINRCGVLTGPWQMGKVDQGFFVLWAARHLYGGSLSYSGFDGKGHQVRDVLHVADLYDLLERQIAGFPQHSGCIYNVGGGAELSLSLAELTELCAARTKSRMNIGSDPVTRAADIPYYVSDCDSVRRATGWQPVRSVERTLDEVLEWLGRYRNQLEGILR